MNKSVFYIVFLISAFLGQAQNLVPNPSFEDIVSCPTMQSQIYLAEPWFQPIYGCNFGNIIDCSSSDLYNSCHVANPPFLNVGVPLSDFGYQFARTGNGYAGIAVWHDNGSRERIEVKLLDSLREGMTYCVSMYVVNKLAAIYSSSLDFTSTSDLHFLFTTDSLLDNHPSGAVYYQPSVVDTTNTIFDDTTNWTLVLGCYVAEGGEQFLTIGDFYNNANSTVVNPNALAAYYFIDDVSVELSDGINCPCNLDDTLINPPGKDDQSYTIPNIFTPNGDGINDVFSVQVEICDDWTLKVINRWGTEVAILDPINPIWDGEASVDGTYFYLMEGVKCNLNKQGFIQLVR